MTDFCILCLTELGCTDPKGWFYCEDTTECICPWCIKEIIEGKNNDDEKIEQKVRDRIVWLDKWLEDNKKHDAEAHQGYMIYWCERKQLQKILGI